MSSDHTDCESDSESDGSSLHAHSHEHEEPTFWTQFVAILKHIMPPIWSRESGTILAYTTVLASRIVFTMKLARLTGMLSSSVGVDSLDKTVATLVSMGLWSLPSALSTGLMGFLEKEITNNFRRMLQHRLHEQYLTRGNFYDLCFNAYIPFLDQRLTGDISMFSHGITHVYGHLVKSVLMTSVLLRSLAQTMGLIPLLAYFSFFALANQMLAMAKPYVSLITTRQQELEGQFRAQHARVIQQAEEIAFLRGEEKEKATCEMLFAAVQQQQAKSNLLTLLSDFFDSHLLQHSGSLMAYCMLIPSVYAARSRNPTARSTRRIASQYITSSALLVALGVALKDIAQQYTVMAQVEGMTSRIFQVLHGLQRIERERASVEARSPPAYGGGDSVRGTDAVTQGVLVRHINIKPPKVAGSGRGDPILIRDLSFKVRPGQHLLVTGSNGSGKTSLFRTLAHLWPTVAVPQRTGSAPGLWIPPGQCIIFVPQKPFSTPGTLLQQVVYPLQAYDLPSPASLMRLSNLLSPAHTLSDQPQPLPAGPADDGDCECGGHVAPPPPPPPTLDTPRRSTLRPMYTLVPEPMSEQATQLAKNIHEGISEQRATEVLRLVGLQNIVKQHYLHEPKTWRELLSGGEQQRLAMARVYYHRPRYVVLDESTAAMSSDIVNLIYQECSRLGITMITIAHDERLQKFHKWRLELLGGGAWRVGKIPQERPKRQSRGSRVSMDLDRNTQQPTE